ncbi:glycolate oxidase iron-sulfur subunit [Burkholderiales bacterium]|nr:glycolate oxidase iron-sulfur subunit [Burkholderiales bacterium]
MQTTLSAEFRDTREGAQAEAILRKCVHCGFCLATCPTYQLLGDELDSPRGRIYLIKQVLEGHAPTRATQQHLDRCLTCRNCETTCPSGVDYGALIDIGRRIVEQRVERPPVQQAVRWLLKEGLTSAALGPALGLGNALRSLLPRALQDKMPRSRAAAGGEEARPWPARAHDRRMLLLAGCVQPHLLPNINRATARVLDAAGIQTIVAPAAGCCGALRAHLADHAGALADMRRNIDAWWPHVEGSGGAAPVEAIVMNASGCGVTVREYASYLADDAVYAAKARRISQCTRDACEIVADLVPALRPHLSKGAARLAVHLPCTLQHGQKMPDTLAAVLRELGFDAQMPAQENHLCCGSAGTYSLLEPELASRLRDRKLAHLRALRAPLIVSANIGCIQHLQSGTDIPVRHWIEILDEMLVT